MPLTPDASVAWLHDPTLGRWLSFSNPSGWLVASTLSDVAAVVAEALGQALRSRGLAVEFTLGALADVARSLTRVGIERVRVDGHTDDVGSARYNDQLSLRRAESVARGADRRAASQMAAPATMTTIRRSGRRFKSGSPRSSRTEAAIQRVGFRGRPVPLGCRGDDVRSLQNR